MSEQLISSSNHLVLLNTLFSPFCAIVYDTVLGELVVEMLALIEGSNPVAGDPDVSLGMLLSEFDRVFVLLKTTDLEAANACLSSYLTYLHGPQTKPTRSGHLFRQAVRMLRAQWTEHDEEKLNAVRAACQAARHAVADRDKMDEASDGVCVATQSPEEIQAAARS